jgi:membrane protein implicated in regulation of membrane protease activity
VGKVELRGSSWSARSARAALARGQRCRVERVDGLTLWVRPE